LRLLIRDDLRDQPGRDGCEHEVTADTDPLVTARRRIKVVAAPVVDYVIAATVFRRYAATATPVGMRLREAAAIELAAGAIVLMSVAAVVMTVEMITWLMPLPLLVLLIAVKSPACRSAS